MQRADQSPLSIYHSYLEQGQLAYQYSPAAQRAVYFPRLVCPFTGSADLEWRIASGQGTVYASTIVYPKNSAPYNVALIDCDEGFRMMSRVEGLPPEDVISGLRVQLKISRDQPDEAPLPAFVPADPADIARSGPC
jgi:uncharacterized OB-fold protein